MANPGGDAYIRLHHSTQVGRSFMSSLRVSIVASSATGALVLALLSFQGCGGSSSAAPSGGAVMGAADVHCKNSDGTMKVVQIGACVSTQASAPAADDGGSADAGDEAGGGDDPGYGETLYNSEGNDDECKYHASFTVTPVRVNEGVTFTLKVNRLKEGTPATGSQQAEAEVFLTDTHPAPEVGTVKESPAGSGTYVFGPIKFDMSGRWTVRFHLFDNCAESEDTPHGHIAFYVDVP
jgi:hypothetical protein